MTTPLKTLRERRQLTVSAVAEACGTDHSNLSRIENGRQRAGLDLAERLAKFFGHEITELQILYPERYVEKEPTP